MDVLELGQQKRKKERKKNSSLNLTYSSTSFKRTTNLEARIKISSFLKIPNLQFYGNIK